MKKALITSTVAGLIVATLSLPSNAAGIMTRVFFTSGASAGTTTGFGNGILGSGAGSIAAGANSAANPSGNAFINTSPSGSTLMPNIGGGTSGGVHRR
ncbi:hypothetical protein [Bradyrhizobium sp.]|uniref:hypothetical protein n=1 Tax=Bradyrhizobium sp. TaxID=376 RepID=UPI003C278BCE